MPQLQFGLSFYIPQRPKRDPKQLDQIFIFYTLTHLTELSDLNPFITTKYIN